jgi:hypothetical protein
MRPYSILTQLAVFIDHSKGLSGLKSPFNLDLDFAVERAIIAGAQREHAPHAAKCAISEFRVQSNCKIYNIYPVGKILKRD